MTNFWTFVVYLGIIGAGVPSYMKRGVVSPFTNSVMETRCGMVKTLVDCLDYLGMVTIYQFMGTFLVSISRMIPNLGWITIIYCIQVCVYIYMYTVFWPWHMCYQHCCTWYNCQLRAIKIGDLPSPMIAPVVCQFRLWRTWEWLWQISPMSCNMLSGIKFLGWAIFKNSSTMAGWWFGTWTDDFSIYWEFHHPNWRSHIFQRGSLKPPARCH